MARVNVEDTVESRPEFRSLLKLVGGDDDRALGMLVRFWRLAQKYWGEGKLVPPSEIEKWGFQPIVESRWGIIKDEGVYAIGGEDRFAWYRQRIEAGKLGGRPKKQPPEKDEISVPPGFRNETESNENPSPGFRNETGITKNIGSGNPLTLTPSLSLVKKRKNIARIGIRAEYRPEFEAVWELYGRIGKKQDASRAFDEMELAVEEYELLKNAIPVYIADCRRNERRQQYFGTFLREDWRAWCRHPSPAAQEQDTAGFEFIKQFNERALSRLADAQEAK